MSINLDGEDSAVTVACLTHQTKPTGTFLGIKVKRNPLLDVLKFLHENNRADFKYSVTENALTTFNAIKSGKANILACTASALTSSITPDTAYALSEMLNEGKFIAIVLINDMDEKMGLARKMLGISSNNEADYAAYVCTPAEFERTLRSIFAEHRPGLVTNDLQSRKNKASLIQSRVDSATSGMAPHLREGVESRIKGGGKNQP